MSIEYVALELMEEVITGFLEMSIFGPGEVQEPQQASGIHSTLISTLDHLSPPISQRVNPIEGVDEGLECKICFGNEIDVSFKECTHGACAACTVGIWKSRVREHNLLPSWFPCHLCRAEVSHLGSLVRGCGDGGVGLGPGEGVILPSVVFRVSRWASVEEWVGDLSHEWGEYVRAANGAVLDAQ